ncbi:hypothetical protein [Embleya sp. NBC_00896]|uniref:hypothetical protein n=1 Tax=Embleya sp. NBC_00896 TaxID=2975961 RepID=UPI0038709099|nr:hypothetical protein OG928_35370 [Embleya sp. NBC_00896]
MDESVDLDALEARFSGGRPSLAERVEATRARAAREAAPAGIDGGAAGEDAAPEPRESPPLPGVVGPPPPDEPGPWIWVRQPLERGLLVCRAVQWERAVSGEWGLRVDVPLWSGYAVPGGMEWDWSQAFQIAPAHALIEVPGQDYRRVPRP